MATLVLTVVGGALGGPIGSAIGGLIGNAVDREIFRPAGRSGPRLSDLRLQTSSYGTPIPRLYGAMRVAGTVIWATDLQEQRTRSRAGKGQPSVTQYSYSASFAVALSSRPIVSVGRIWADGKLLRGAAGDWKAPCVFRLHPGGEAQPPDPLIAAREGLALAPANRGVACAVFEDLQLADFGNRIPSLTFEVMADAGAIAAGTIVRDVSGGTIAAADAGLMLHGFAAQGRASEVAAVLAEVSGARFAPAGDGLAMATGDAPARTLSDDGRSAGRGEGQGRRVRVLRPMETVPRTLALAHHDPVRDYQTGVQQAVRPGAGHRHDRVDLPAALTPAGAAAAVHAMLARAEAERCRRTILPGVAAIDVAPGTVVEIAGEAGRWRVAAASVAAMAVSLELVPLPTAIPAGPADGGRGLETPDLVAGTTLLIAAELPALADEATTQPRLTVAACGTGAGWRRAALLLSVDDRASWIEAGGTAAPAVVGTLASELAEVPATLRDQRSELVVDLAHATAGLESADTAAIDGGANLALVGEELLQFARAEPVGARRWRLTGLLRGRRGTAPAAHAPGARFMLVEADAIVSMPLPAGAIGRTVRLMASGVGDGAPVETSVAIDGRSIAPPAPVHLRVERGGDAATLSWVRRSRSGWTWGEGGTPLGEERETYRVTIATAAGERVAVAGEPWLSLSPDERAGGFRAQVRQVGTHAVSPPTSIIVEGEDI